MARLARVEVFAADEIAIVHVMNRTVRRCIRKDMARLKIIRSRLSDLSW